MSEHGTSAGPRSLYAHEVTDLLDLPEQRLSHENDPELPPAQQFEVNGYWSHCRCCNAYTPPPCPLIHPRPCGKPTCSTTRDVT